jgi:glyoxylase-like metal-dependent hydrolase (beta-lactamase superfamily II)
MEEQDPVVALAPAVLSEYEGHAGLGSPVVHRVTEGVYAVTGLYHMTVAASTPGVNAGIVFAGDHVVFIDCGMSEVAGEFLWRIAAPYLGPHSRVYLILTHSHSDHVFGMGIFRDRGATVIAHRATVGWLQDDGNWFKAMMADHAGWTAVEADSVFGDVSLSLPDVLLDGDTSLSLDGDELRILAIPGHVPGELVVYHPSSRTLFGGDAIYEGMVPTMRFGAPDDWRTWVEQLERVRDLDIATIVPGHGALGPATLLDANIEALQLAIRDAPSTPGRPIPARTLQEAMRRRHGRR